jgi:uncharacterized protein YdhG (YjbR/CyaY superfamily)
MGKRTVAEFVENDRVRERLRELRAWLRNRSPAAVPGALGSVAPRFMS